MVDMLAVQWAVQTAGLCHSKGRKNKWGRDMKTESKHDREIMKENIKEKEQGWEKKEDVRGAQCHYQ